MDRTKTTDEHSKALRRVVAVLLAFADLAERASGRSFAVRSLVLWLLGSAEVLTRGYLAKLTRDTAVQAEQFRFTRYSAAEAIRLAASFRQLAASLTALAVDDLAPGRQTCMARFGVPAGLPAVPGSPMNAVERRDSS